MASQHILSGPEISLTVPDISLGGHLYERLVSNGDAVAMVDAVTGETRTFADILVKSLSVAECLRARGVAVGDTVSICSENSLEYILPVLATYYIGAICAPLNPNFTAREMLHAINISKPRIIFCSDKPLASVDEVSRQVGFLKEIVTFGSPMSHKHTPFVTFLRDKSCSFQPLDSHDVNLVATVLCSSGTTGLPKGVMLTQKNILTVLVYLMANGTDVEEELSLAILPMFHAYGFICQLLLTVMRGSKVVVMKRFEEHLFLRSIQNYKIKRLNLVPPLVVFLAKADIVDKYDLSSLQRIYCGAAPLSEETETRVKKRLGIDAVIQGYGLTEATLLVVGPPESGVLKKGSVGTLKPGIKCKVVDLETGKNLGPYKKGELRFSGPCIMKGYYGNPEATAASFDSDGFLLTGDVGYYDEDGYFFIVDRVKELIKYKGYQVPPAELEAMLLTHPAVKDVGVVGVPDEAAGELPIAIVVKQPGATVTEKEIIKYAADHLSPHKRLHGGVLFAESIPRTPSGKVLRRELRIMLKSKM